MINETHLLVGGGASSRRELVATKPERPTSQLLHTYDFDRQRVVINETQLLVDSSTDEIGQEDDFVSNEHSYYTGKRFVIIINETYLLAGLSTDQMSLS